jgi:hypothetical protein
MATTRYHRHGRFSLTPLNLNLSGQESVMGYNAAFFLKLLHILDIKPLSECVQNFLKQYLTRITDLLLAQRTYHEERIRRTGRALRSPNVSPTFNVNRSKLPIYAFYTCVSIFRITNLDASHGDDRMNCRQSVNRIPRVYQEVHALDDFASVDNPNTE